MKYFLIYLSVSAMLLTYCNSDVESLNDQIESKENLTTLDAEEMKQATKTFNGKGYSIDIPGAWVSKSVSDNQVLFTGPQVGNAHVGFYITHLVKGDKSYLIAAEKTKIQQSTNENYSVLEEKDISQSGFKAYMRRAHWFEKDIDMELFVREIFTESTDYVYILSASIPNTPELKTLDKVIVNMMNSFQFK